MKFLTTAFVIVIFLGINIFPVLANVRTSTNYSIETDSLNFAGTEGASSASYEIADTAGETGTGRSNSSGFTTAAGYRQTESGPQPPTIPQDLEATVVSSTQVDLSWSASTDNVAVTGYEIYRDSVLIDTTTSTTYSDNVLLSGLTYEYQVQAYDGGGNKSGLSSSVFATTLAESFVESGGFSGNPNPFDVNTEVFTDSSNVSWKTEIQTSYKFSWGLTLDYELGTILGTEMSNGEIVTLGNLKSGRLYYFEIETNTSGLASGLYRGTFTTTTLISELIPNVTNLNAWSADESIILDWTNPDDQNFSGVTVVRSDNFYPQDILDGKIVYEGTGESVSDSQIEKDKVYYYTVFSRDKQNNYSSGTVISISVSEGKIYFEDDVKGSPDPQIKALKLSDFYFEQDGKKVPVTGRKLRIEKDRQITISIDYEEVPEILKTIAIELVDSSNRNSSFTFLLRVDEGQEKYTATIGALRKEGEYEMYVRVFDYKNQGVKVIRGVLSASASIAFEKDLGQYFMLPAFIGIIILMFVSMYQVIRKFI